ncbi:MFS transporter [Cellulomonas telluris]|uniref:MFS transporter n=1 Tax=Cellulomonas telluris TaxID=2306636 RepID=UPI001CA3BE1E|nr:MFS transporter [Cellulomonas telluris]
MTEVDGRDARRPLFAGGILLGLVAEQIVLFAVPLLIFQHTGQVAMLGLAFALEWIPALVAYPFAGLVADRDGGGRLFRVVNGARGAVLALAVVVCVVQPEWTTGTLITCGALLSFFVAPVKMSIEKMVPLLAKGDRVAPTQALVQNMELLAMAVGPAVAIAAALLLSKVVLLTIAAAAFAAAALCWLGLPRGMRVEGRISGSDVVADLSTGWRLLVANRPVLLLGALNFTINLVVATLMAANVALVTGVFGAPEAAFGLLNVVVGLVGLVNLWASPRLLRRTGVETLGVGGFALLCVALVVAGLAPSYAVYAPAYVLALVGVTLYNIFNRTRRLQVIPEEHLGKVMGPFYLVNLLSFPLAGVLVAGLGDVGGPRRLVLGLTAVLCVVGSLLLVLTMRAFRAALAARADQELVEVVP